MVLSNSELVEKLKDLGVVGLTDNKVISYSGFKSRADVHKYGKSLKIVFLGSPTSNLFGFYVMYNANDKVIKEAYEMLLRLVAGDMIDYNEGDIQWGQKGIPISYGNLR